MAEIPEEFSRLLPKVAGLNGPMYHLWVFNPEDGSVLIETPEDKKRVEQRYHAELAEDVPHPDRVHGYAYVIRGGWRITDWEHRPIEDPYIRNTVARALDGKEQKRHKPSREAQLVLRSKA